MDQVADLEDLLEQALARVRDPRRIWLQAALGFDSRIELARGMILGGVHSPHLLTKTPVGDLRFRVPYTTWLDNPRLLVCPRLATGFQDWLPLLEALTKSRDALLLVTPGMESDDLQATLLTNHLRSVIRCAAIGTGLPESQDLNALAEKVDTLESRSGSRPTSYLPAGEAPGAQLLDRLPKGHRSGLRRGCSVVLPGPGAEAGPHLSEIAILEIGGENAEDQMERLLFVEDQLRILEKQATPG